MAKLQQHPFEDGWHGVAAQKLRQARCFSGLLLDSCDHAVCRQAALACMLGVVRSFEVVAEVLHCSGQGICFGRYHRLLLMAFEKRCFHLIIFENRHTPQWLQADESSKNRPTPIALQTMVVHNLLRAHHPIISSFCVPISP
jgi:hypothetical protein